MKRQSRKLSISEELDRVPGLPTKKFVPSGPVPIDEVEGYGIDAHIEIMGILREDIGVFRKLLERGDLRPRLRAAIEKQIYLDRRCIEHSMREIGKTRDAQKAEAEQRRAERLPRAGQGSFQL